MDGGEGRSKAEARFDFTIINIRSILAIDKALTYRMGESYTPVLCRVFKCNLLFLLLFRIIFGAVFNGD